MNWEDFEFLLEEFESHELSSFVHTMSEKNQEEFHKYMQLRNKLQDKFYKQKTNDVRKIYVNKAIEREYIKYTLATIGVLVLSGLIKALFGM